VHITFPSGLSNMATIMNYPIGPWRSRSARARGEPRARASPLVETELSEQMDEL